MIKKTPPMGFNTWNTFGECFNEQVLKEIADAFVDRGFRNAGYEYLIIDDHWSLEWRDETTGELIPRPLKFKDSNILPTIEYIHSKGLKAGIYGDAGVRTCGSKMGSFEHEFTDASTFAKWGIDYLKYDYCLRPERLGAELLYRRMGIALREQDRDIFFAACNWGLDNVWAWARSAGADSYRSTGDIYDNFEVVKQIYKSQTMKLGASIPGCFNDIDMLTVGMEGKGQAASGDFGGDGIYRIQFAVWCFFGAPLIMGCDLRTVSDRYRDLLCNRELIRINQDTECRPAFPISNDEYNSYCKLLSGGEYAFLLVNVNKNKSEMGFIPHDIGLTDESGLKIYMTDVMTGEKLVFRDFVSVPVEGMDCRAFRARFSE